MTDDEVKAMAEALAAEAKPLPRAVMEKLTDDQLRLASEIYKSAGRQRFAVASELDALKHSKKYPQ